MRNSDQRVPGGREWRDLRPAEVNRRNSSRDRRIDSNYQAQRVPEEAAVFSPGWMGFWSDFDYCCCFCGVFLDPDCFRGCCCDYNDVHDFDFVLADTMNVGVDAPFPRAVSNPCDTRSQSDSVRRKHDIPTEPYHRGSRYHDDIFRDVRAKTIPLRALPGKAKPC